jgi:cephalosporin-C deacetylase-like acetyl esterase
MAFSAIAAQKGGIAQQSALEETPGPSVKRDYWNDFPNYLTAKVNAARLKRKTQLDKTTTVAQVKERASYVRSKVWDLIGGPIEKTLLNPVMTGIIERGDYRIQKLIFESQPEFYVPAHLYLPKGTGPFPAVLAPLGHTPEGKAYKSYQILFQNLARNGYVVLTWDPPGQGERLQYINGATNRSEFGPTGEHDQFGWPALLIGSSATQFELIDGVRALDYLSSRPEVDSNNIGCCGHSGGGTQTMFLCGLETRIKAAVVVEGNTENVAGANYQPPGAYADAEQNIIGSLQLGIDRGDLLGAFAPNPLLICYTPVDAGTTYAPHYIEGTHEILDELRSAYGILGAPERVALSRSPLPHDYDYFHRQATYQWFNKWLRKDGGNIVEVAFDEAPERDLWCTPTGQIITSLGGRPAFRVNLDRLRRLRNNSHSPTPSKSQVRAELRSLLNLPSERISDRGTVLSKNTLRNIIVEEIQYSPEANIRVPGYFLRPESGSGKQSVVVFLNQGGKDAIFDQFDVVEELAAQGVGVCSIDLRTTGVTTPHLPIAGPEFYGRAVDIAYQTVCLTAGLPIIGQQVWDLLGCIDYLSQRPEVDAGRIGVFGTGLSGLPTMLAAALDQRINSVLLMDTLVSFESIVASEQYHLPLSYFSFGMLRKFDLPEICSAIAPRPVWLLNAVGAQGEPLPLSTISPKYEVAKRAYQAAGHQGRLTIRVDSIPVKDLVRDWTRAVLA